MTSGVYVIENTVTHRVYIGSAANIEHRWHTHWTMLKQGRHHNVPLSRAWEIKTTEQLYLDWLFPSGMLYNVCIDANGHNGMRRSAATRAKQSLSAIIVAFNEDERARRSVRARFQHALGLIGQVTWPKGMVQLVSAKRHLTRKFNRAMRLEFIP